MRMICKKSRAIVYVRKTTNGWEIDSVFEEQSKEVQRLIVGQITENAAWHLLLAGWQVELKFNGD